MPPAPSGGRWPPPGPSPGYAGSWPCRPPPGHRSRRRGSWPPGHRKGSGGLAAAGTRTVRGLVIGIDDYAPGIGKLRGAVNDARDIGQALAGMGVDDLTVLLDGDATRDRILAEWQGLLARAGPGRYAGADLCRTRLAGTRARCRDGRRREGRKPAPGRLPAPWARDPRADRRRRAQPVVPGGGREGAEGGLRRGLLPFRDPDAQGRPACAFPDVQVHPLHADDGRFRWSSICRKTRPTPARRGKAGSRT